MADPLHRFMGNPIPKTGYLEMASSREMADQIILAAATGSFEIKKTSDSGIMIFSDGDGQLPN